MDRNKISRICLYEAERGPLTIKLQASANIVAGIDFKIYRPDVDEHFKQWKMGVQNTTLLEQALPADVLILNKCILTWQILVCGRDLETTAGTVHFSFAQKEHHCRINIPTSWNFTDIPPCAVKAYSKITESLIFMIKT